MKRLLFLGTLTVWMAQLTALNARTPLLLGDPFAQPADVQDIVILTPNRPVFVRLHLKLDGTPYRQAWGDFFKYLHNHLDANKDGLLDAGEQKNMPKAQALFNLPLQHTFTTVRIFDTRDGKVIVPAPPPPQPKRVKDLIDHYRKLGAAPFRTRTNPYGNVRVWTTMRAPTVNASTLNQALLKALDRDKDGRISKAELAAMERRMLKRDFDDDEVLTTTETQGKAAPDYRGIEQIAFSVDYAGGSSATSRLIEVTSPRPGDAQRLAQRLLTTYGPLVSSEDSLGLTRQQLGMTKQSFAGLDRNKDNVLDSSELTCFTMRKPDVEVTVDVGDKNNAGVARMQKALPAIQTLRLGAIRLDFRTPGGAASKSSSIPTTAVDEKGFAKADIDNNGYLDAMEALQSPYASTFRIIDVDKNEKLFLKEVKAYHRKYQTLLDRAQASYVSIDVADDGRGLFGLIDTDRDDRLSVREMRNAVRLLKGLDRDGDGALSIKEIPRRYDVTLAAGTTPGSVGYVSSGLRIRDGSPPASSRRSLPKETPLWFKKMDRNRDGDVSVREFLGAGALFDQIDADRDQLLSVDEARRADKRHRKEGR